MDVRPTPSAVRRLDPPLTTGPARVRPKGAAPDHSGFIIIRLASELAADRGNDLLDAAKRLDLRALASLLDAYDLTTSRRVVRSLPPETIRELEREAAATELPPLHSLTSYWRVDARGRTREIEEILKRLNELPEVDLAYRELAATDPVVSPADDDYNADQGYLDAAPTGIDARWVWTQPDGEGAGITIVDLEQGWIPAHEDLAPKAPVLLAGDNRHNVGTYRGNHGTAVLGEIVGTDNAVGIVGAAPAVTTVRMASHFDLATMTTGHVADAIVGSMPSLQPGDLLLLEIQRNFLPTEIDDADFDAIRLAVAHGVVVVEAAGNGNNDLDAFTDAGGQRILNRGDADFRDSGAIMCGASESALPHDRWQFSNFGTRIDCYGWGENVVTCGYGDLDDGGGDENRRYTDTFGGTSSASPIVVGAAILVQSMYEATAGTRLSPTQMRALLADPATGTPQGPGRAGFIGVMPDLNAIVTTTLGVVPDVYLRDNVADTGTVPSGSPISASPDIIVRPDAVPDPVGLFGEGSGNESSSTLGYEAEAGQDNFLYVRVRNRGSSDAAAVTATIYWSEVATLVTPASWNLIGTTAPVNVPQGDTIVVAGPLTWPAADVPGTGHYCFVGLLDHPGDPAPPIPGPLASFDDFRALIRGQNNVTWRNFNVVDELPDPSGDPATLPFLVAGAPDRRRRFRLEILQHLPRGAAAWLQVPLGLAAQLRKGRLWKVEIDRKRRYALLRLPTQPRVDLGEVALAARARYPSRILVKGAKGMERGGHGVAIRQLYEDEEVGRVTWQFFVRAEKDRKRQRRREVPEYTPMLMAPVARPAGRPG